MITLGPFERAVAVRFDPSVDWWGAFYVLGGYRRLEQYNHNQLPAVGTVTYRQKRTIKIFKFVGTDDGLGGADWLLSSAPVVYFAGEAVTTLIGKNPTLWETVYTDYLVGENGAPPRHVGPDLDFYIVNGSAQDGWIGAGTTLIPYSEDDLSPYSADVSTPPPTVTAPIIGGPIQISVVRDTVIHLTAQSDNVDIGVSALITLGNSYEDIEANGSLADIPPLIETGSVVFGEHLIQVDYNQAGYSQQVDTDQEQNYSLWLAYFDGLQSFRELPD